MWFDVAPCIYGVLGRKEITTEVFNEKVKALKSQLTVLNSYLKGKYYIVGDNVTIADIVIAVYLIMPFQTLLDAGYRSKAISNVTEWFERVMALPAVVKYCGYVKPTDKPFKPFDPNAKVEPIKEAKPAGGKKGGKKEAEKAEDDVDMDDLFGDDDEDAAEAAKKAAEAAKAGAKKKKVVIAMSSVLLEVKPLDD